MSDYSFVMSQGCVPEGQYEAVFARIEKFDEHADKYGEALLLVWTVVSGDRRDEEATRICSRKFSPRSNLAKFAASLRGQPIAPGEPFSFEDYFGVRGTILVEETDSGSTRVASFVRTQS